MSCLEVQITQIVQEMFRSTESPDRAEEISKMHMQAMIDTDNKI